MLHELSRCSKQKKKRCILLESSFLGQLRVVCLKTWSLGINCIIIVLEIPSYLFQSGQVANSESAITCIVSFLELYLCIRQLVTLFSRVLHSVVCVCPFLS